MKTDYPTALKLTLMMMALTYFQSTALSEKSVKKETILNCFKSVEITELRAELIDRTAVLYFEVANQIDNALFTVEKSTDMENWSDIGIIPGGGTINHSEVYEFTDSKLEEGTAYYRIKMTDFQGNFTYSTVCALEIKFTVNETSVYPIPASQNLSIKITEEWEGTLFIEVLDISGAVRYSNEHFNANDRIAIDHLTEGIYLLKITYGNKTELKKFIKQTCIH